MHYMLWEINVDKNQDVCFGVAPLTVADAREMVRTPKESALLRGFRGSPPYDVAALEEVLLRVSRLADELPQVKELDLNPILAYCDGRGCLLVDARVRLAPTGWYGQ